MTTAVRWIVNLVLMAASGHMYEGAASQLRMHISIGLGISADAYHSPHRISYSCSRLAKVPYNGVQPVDVVSLTYALICVSSSCIQGRIDI